MEAYSAPVKTAPSSPKLNRLLREAGWIVFLGIALYLALVLGTYHPADPGWSHSVKAGALLNKGGVVGAYLADVLLYVFGLSAWWWVGLAAYAVLRIYNKIDTWNLIDRRHFAVSLVGFVLVLSASAALEALRLHSMSVALPGAPGGALGMMLAAAASQAFGFTGATLVLLIIMVASISLFTGLSWIRFAEKIGAALEALYNLIVNKLQERRDRREGVIATSRRDEHVEEIKRVLDLDDAKPLRVASAYLEVPQSERVAREKQAPLFQDMPDSPLPPLSLLDPSDVSIERPSLETLEFTSGLIERKLLDFNVQVKVVAAYPGPVITRYEIEPAVGVKGSQVVNLARDLARALSVISIRVVETIPGTSHMGLEIPNPRREIVRLSEILGSQVYANMHSRLAIAMGKDIAGKPVVADLARMPHLLVAGTTGSGKSVAINAMILSLIYKATPNEVRLIFIDPKMLELSVYEGIAHLLAPVVTDMRQAGAALNWCVAEMDRRYRLLSSLGVRNLSGYNQKIEEARQKGEPLKHPFSLTPDDPEQLEPLPLIVVVIDELADMMMVVGKKVEELIARLAQKARASGIHLILATQRPSVDVITGLIKANVPTRVAFQVSSKIDSRTILDQQGAEALLGQGDMLYLPPGSGMPQRVHGAFVADAEVHRVVQYLKKQGAPAYVEGILDAPEDEQSLESNGTASGEADPLYDQAVTIILENKRASISLVQRHLRIGYNRAARLLEDMERAGLVSPMQSNGNREIIAPNR